MQILSQTENLVNTALEYSGRGWSVFPLHSVNDDLTCTCGKADCKNTGKHPRTANGFKDATTDEAQIREWWELWPDANIGIATGNGLVVVDVDPKNGGTLEALGTLPETAMVNTGGGGWHLYFSIGKGLTLKSSAGKVASGVDVRGEGGYVVAAPSRHVSGKHYTWANGSEPVGMPLNLYQRVWQAQYNFSSKQDSEGEEDEVVEEGGRNAYLASKAGTLRRSGLPEEGIEAALQGINQKMCVPPLLEDEVYRIAHSISRYAPAEKPEVQKSKPTSIDAAQEDADLLEFEADDRGNAEAVQHLYGRILYYTDAYGWLVWNGQYYERNEAKVKLLVEETLSRRFIAAYVGKKKDIERVSKCDVGRINSCVETLRYKLTADVKDFDNNPDLLNCANGVVDLRTGDLYPHTSAQKFTYVIPIDYDPDADASLWTTTLSGTVGGGQEVLDYLQRAMGYSFTGHTNEESLFYLYGPTRSGKGTFTETLLSLLPHPLATEVDFNTFTAKREGDNQNFDLAPLKPARLVFASESNKYQSLNPAKIKALTGGNMVWCAFKHRDMFSYKPQYTVWLSSNHPVNGDVDDNALWGRLKVIEFPNSYLGKEDKTLKQRLRTPEQLQGVLRWVVDGAVKWYAEGGLTTPEAVKIATQKHRDELDTVQEWLDECTTKDTGKDGWASNEAIMRSYKEWCYQNTIEPKSIKYLSMSLKTKGYTTGVQKKENGVNKKSVAGLRIN